MVARFATKIAGTQGRERERLLRQATELLDTDEERRALEHRTG
jgi:hypothetical protein